MVNGITIKIDFRGVTMRGDIILTPSGYVICSQRQNEPGKVPLFDIFTLYFE